MRTKSNVAGAKLTGGNNGRRYAVVIYDMKKEIVIAVMAYVTGINQAMRLSFLVKERYHFTPKVISLNDVNVGMMQRWNAGGECIE
ncbi:hypothetical protein IV55_GL000697 [Furfurilactobacillus siliginis]|uniref:Uncharacterized protein n=1 Tax=Furfurilactobacillus siliginis TaxID=348151 RepID=A0A0R2L545_9LACO|nr:hypothetical protein IV55_GL000697 [Furfurilactobacillus siliginis]